MTISGYDCWKRKGLSRRRKLENVGVETTSSGSPFLIRGPETLKVRLPTVDSRNIVTTRRLELTERNGRRPCRSATRSSGPRYRGVVSWRTLYVSTAILYWMRRKLFPIYSLYSRLWHLAHFTINVRLFWNLKYWNLKLFACYRR